MKRTNVRTALLSAATAAICWFPAWIPSDCLAAAITLVWDPGASGTAGYFAYCGETTRIYSSRDDVGMVTSIKVQGLLEGATYYCAVTAYDAGKQESDYSNEVSATIPYAVPVVAFTASPSSGTVPTEVTFNNATTGEVTKWAWSFGDGSTDSERSPTHVYSAPGDYWVTLTVIGPAGSAAKTLETPIKIAAPSTTTKKGKGRKRQ